ARLQWTRRSPVVESTRAPVAASTRSVANALRAARALKESLARQRPRGPSRCKPRRGGARGLLVREHAELGRRAEHELALPNARALAVCAVAEHRSDLRAGGAGGGRDPRRVPARGDRRPA